MSKEEKTAFEKALDARFGEGFAEMSKKAHAKTTYACGCHNAGNNSWYLCDEHQEMIVEEMET